MQKQVDDWVKNYKGGVYTLTSQNNVFVDFNKYIDLNVTNSRNNHIGTFVLSRKSFKTRIPKICGYSNYFFEYYGSDRFLQNLFMVKVLVDSKQKKLKTKSFIELMKKYLITPDVEEKIWEMVEYNYLNILDKNNPIVKNSKDAKDDYFRYQIISDKNGKRIMCSVIAIDLIYPLVVHYTYIREKKNDDLFQYFAPFLDMFSTEEIDNIQKLSMYTWSILSIHYSHNKPLWRHKAVLGDMSIDEFYDKCFRKYIVTDSLPWLIFDNNMGSFFYKILQEQLNYYIRAEYETMPVELNMDKDEDEGFSEMEKFENRLSKIDEGLVILSETNVHSVIETIKTRFNMYISSDELEFYISNLHFSKDQHVIINYHYAKYFNGYRDLKMIDKNTFVEMALIMRFRLLAQGMVYLPYILTGNLKKKGVANKINVDKVLKKVTKSKYYKEIMNNKFGYIVAAKNQNPIIKLLRSILVSTYTYVDYYNPDLNGEDIEFDMETLVYEFLQFIDQI